MPDNIDLFRILLSMIGVGFVLIFKKDRAWRMVEPILRGVKPQRTPEWGRYSTINGVILVLFGLVTILFILGKL